MAVPFYKITREMLKTSIGLKNIVGAKEATLSVLIRGVDQIAGPPMRTPYNLQLNKSEKFPANDPSAALALQIATKEEAAAHQGPITNDEVGFRRWLDMLQDVMAEAILAGKKLDTDGESLTRVKDSFEPPYKDVSDKRKAEVPLVHLKCFTTLKEGCSPPTDLFVNQDNYDWPQHRFYKFVKVDGKPTLMEMDYQLTPKHKCVQRGSLVQANFKIGWVSRVQSRIRIALKLCDAVVKPCADDTMKRTDVDPALLGEDVGDDQHHNGNSNDESDRHSNDGATSDDAAQGNSVSVADVVEAKDSTATNADGWMNEDYVQGFDQELSEIEENAINAAKRAKPTSEAEENAINAARRVKPTSEKNTTTPNAEPLPLPFPISRGDGPVATGWSKPTTKTDLFKPRKG